MFCCTSTPTLRSESSESADYREIRTPSDTLSPRVSKVAQEAISQTPPPPTRHKNDPSTFNRRAGNTTAEFKAEPAAPKRHENNPSTFNRRAGDTTSKRKAEADTAMIPEKKPEFSSKREEPIYGMGPLPYLSLGQENKIDVPSNWSLLESE